MPEPQRFDGGGRGPRCTVGVPRRGGRDQSLHVLEDAIDHARPTVSAKPAASPEVPTEPGARLGLRPPAYTAR